MTHRSRTSTRARACRAGALLATVWFIGACSASTPTDAAASRDGTSSPAPPPGTAAASGTTAPPAAPACTPARAVTPASGDETVASGGMERTYRLALPAKYDGATAVPLIFNLHGSGSNKEQQALYSDLENQGTARGYAVVTADGTGARRGWNMFRTPDGADDYRFIEDLFGRLDASLCLDPDRVYSTGISNGSAFSGFLACVSPFRLAAIAMVAATVPGGNCPPGVRVSAMAFHGTEDPVVPYGGGAVAAEAAKGNAAPGAENTMSFWADLDGCDATPVEDRPWPHVKRLTFGHCQDGTEVVFYGIEGGGHTWPGSPVDLSALGISALGPSSNEADATALMLDFFDRHRRVGRPTGP